MAVLKQRWGFGARHIQVFLLSLALFKDSWVILTASVTNSGIFSIIGFDTLFDTSLSTNQNYKWISFLVLILSKLLGAVLTVLLNSKYVILSVTLIQSACLFAVPSVKSIGGVEAACFLILVIECMSAIQVPSVYTLMGRWIPHTEYARCTALMATMSIFALPVHFVSLQSLINLNFAFSYYFGGSLVFLWCICWLVFSSPDAGKCFFISKEEMDFIVTNIPVLRKSSCTAPFPFREILLCFPFYGYILVDSSVELYKVTGGPHKMIHSYYKNVIGYDNKDAMEALVSSYVYIGICMILIGFGLDKILSLGVNTNNLRKVTSSIMLWTYGLSVAYLGYSESPKKLVYLQWFSMLFLTLSALGHGIVPLDLTANYAGFMIGISRCFASLFEFLMDDLEKDVLRTSIIKNSWNHFYYYTGAAIFITNTIFLMCGDIHRRDFDHVGAYDWRQESIHSYP